MVLNVKRKENGFPLISRQEMEQLGEDILREYAQQTLMRPQPTDIRYLAEEGIILDIVEAAFDSKYILGLIVFDDVKLPLANNEVLDVHEGTIVISQSLHNNIPKRRFTIGHELAHWVLHRSYHSPGNAEYAFCQSRFSYISSKNDEREKGKKNPKEASSAEDWQEWQSDYLSNVLLMPRTTFAEAAAALMKEYGFNDLRIISGERKAEEKTVIKRLADTFQVSERGAQIRMRQLEMYVSDTHS